jgi:hypothetical protein
MVSTAMSAILKNLNDYQYEGDHKNFTFETYVIKHVEQHNLHNELSDYGVQPLAEDPKIHYFQKGIVDPTFAAVRSTIIAASASFQTFDAMKEQFMTYKKSLPQQHEPV